MLNASPDLREQIAANPELAASPSAGLRNSPLKAVVLTNADIDHIAGLLNLREGQAFHLYASERVLQALDTNSVFDVLRTDLVQRITVRHGELFEPPGCPGLSVELFTVPGKVALYLENPDAGPNFGSDEGDVVGLKLIDNATGRFACYVPGCASVDHRLKEWMAGASVLLFDGTLFADDEMIAQGLSQKTGRRMGHISMTGEDGSIAMLADAKVERRIFTHINNSNPVLREDSAERGIVETSGWEIAEDGMDIRF